MLSVSSWWYERAAIYRETPERELLVITDQGSVYDLSSQIKTWPTIKRKCNEFKVAGFTFQTPLTEVASYHAFLVDRDPLTMMRATWQVRVGYTHPASGPEMVTLFTGRTRERTVGNGMGTFEIEAADTRLTERKLGSDGTSAAVVYDDPVLAPITVALATPADIAWTLCTSAGGMDPTQTTANSDLNFSSVLSWHGTFSESFPAWHTYMEAKGTGQKVAGILSELLKQGHSLGWVGLDGRLAFKRRNGVDGPFAPVATIADDLIVDANYAELRDHRPNQIEGYYYTAWGDISGAIIVTNTANVLAYGLQEDEWQSENAYQWSTFYVEVMARQVVGDTLHLQQTADMVLPFAGIFYDLGDTVQITNTPHLVNSTHWSILAHEVNLENLNIKLKLEEREPKILVALNKALGDYGEIRTLAKPLNSLLDVDSTAPSSGQVLTWDGGSMWIPSTPAAGTGTVPTHTVYFNAAPTAYADSNAAGAPHFAFGTYRHVHIADLTAYTQVKFVAQRATAVSVAAYEMELMFCDTFVTDIGSYQALTVTSRCAMNPEATYTEYETGWLTIVASARTLVHLGIMAQSGNGTADPNFGFVLALFKP